MPLDDLFSPFFFGWLKDTKTNLLQIATLKHKSDKLQMISEHEWHSPVIGEIFTEFLHSYKFLQELHLRKQFYYSQFVEIICHAAIEYASILYKVTL
jgi:hypothetical protein